MLSWLQRMDDLLLKLLLAKKLCKQTCVNKLNPTIKHAMHSAMLSVWRYMRLFYQVQLYNPHAGELGMRETFRTGSKWVRNFFPNGSK